MMKKDYPQLPPPSPEKEVGVSLGLGVWLLLKCAVLTAHVAVLKVRNWALLERLKEYDRMRKEAKELRERLFETMKAHRRFMASIEREYGVRGLEDPFFLMYPNPEPVDLDDMEDGADYEDHPQERFYRH